MDMDKDTARISAEIKQIINSGELSDQDLRLFAVRCARRVQPETMRPGLAVALYVAERYAIGKVDDDERCAAWDDATKEVKAVARLQEDIIWHQTEAAELTLMRQASGAAWEASLHAAWAIGAAKHPEYAAFEDRAEREAQLQMLRDAIEAARAEKDCAATREATRADLSGFFVND